MRHAFFALMAAAMLTGVSATGQTTQILGQRASDAIYTADGLTQAISGTVVEFYDGSRARYDTDGAYSYTYQEGDPPFVGTWTVRDVGEVCVTFENGSARCDHFVRSGDRMVLIIANGDRYPVRTKATLE